MTSGSAAASISPEEAADRVAIRALIDAYAHCADRRDADGQMALFTADSHFVVHMDAGSSEPSMELHSRAELAPVFADLNRYVATTQAGRNLAVLRAATVRRLDRHPPARGTAIKLNSSRYEAWSNARFGGSVAR
jgi:hypothetical protein